MTQEKSPMTPDPRLTESREAAHKWVIAIERIIGPRTPPPTPPASKIIKEQ